MSSARLRRGVRVVVGFAVALVVVGLFLRAAGTERVVAQLRTADPRFVALGALAAVTAVLLWSEAQRQALRVTAAGVGGLSFRAAYLTGDFTKQVLPMGHMSGPAIMAYAIGSVLDIEYERTLAAITISDLLNLVASVVLATAGLCVLLARSSVDGLGVFVAGLTAAVVGIVALVTLVTFRRSTLTRFVLSLSVLGHRLGTRVSPRLDGALAPTRIERRLDGYYRTLDTVSADRNRVAAAAAFAVAGWVCYAVPLYASGLALGVSVPLALAVFIVPLAGLATWFPLPGGLGGVEVAVTAGLIAVAGLDLGVAAAVALLYRFCSYWFVILFDGTAALYLFSQ